MRAQPPSRLLPLLCTVALLQACAHVPQAASLSLLSRSLSPEEVSVPDTAAGFQLRDTERYEDAVFGLRYRYESTERPGAWADLFLYPIDLSDGASLAHVLELEQERLDAEIEATAQRRQTRLGPALIDSWAAPRGVLSPGIVGFRDLSRGELSFRSYSFLSVHQALYLKVRLTLPSSDELMDEDPLEPFLEAISDALVVEPASPRKLTVTLEPAILQLGQEKDCDFTAWVAYGNSQLGSIQAGRYLDSFDRELEARQSALDAREALAAGAEHPCGPSALQALAEARDRGLLREYVWWNYQRTHWTQPADLDLEAYAIWAGAQLPEDHDPVYFPEVQVRWEAD